MQRLWRSNLFSLLSLLIMADSTFAAPPEPQVHLVEIAPGVYAALQDSERRFNDSNSAVILTDRAVVVVDSQTDSAWVQALIGEIQSLSALPVRYVINSHWHGDHTDGNHLYREAFPGVDFIAHHSVVEDVTGRATPDRAEQITRYQSWIKRAEKNLAFGQLPNGEDLKDQDRDLVENRISKARHHLKKLLAINPVLPTITYENSMILDLGSRQIHLLHATAHTRGDTVVFLPEEKVLITGDLLDELPFGGHGFPTAWIKTLDHLETLDFEKIIPGHGPVLMGKDPLRRIRALIRSVIAQVHPLVERGLPLEDIQEQIDLAPFRLAFAGEDPVAQRNFDGFMPPLVGRVFLEATGKLEPTS